MRYTPRLIGLERYRSEAFPKRLDVRQCNERQGRPEVVA
jgi:hypothetical protein